MASRTIPQRELRNHVGEILREAEAGTEFTITVRGRPVAHLGPAGRPRTRRVDVDPATLPAVLAATPVDERFAKSLTYAAARMQSTIRGIVRESCSARYLDCDRQRRCGQARSWPDSGDLSDHARRAASWCGSLATAPPARLDKPGSPPSVTPSEALTIDEAVAEHYGDVLATARARKQGHRPADRRYRSGAWAHPSFL